MTPEEMRARSAEKIKKVHEFMQSLNVRVESKQKIVQNNYLENVIVFVDDERYPSPEPVQPPAPKPATETEATSEENV